MRTYPRLAQPEQRELLSSVIGACSGRAPGAAPRVVVFDLDGTLLDNRPRTVTILRELAEGPLPALADAVGRLTVTGLKYLIEDTLASVGVTEPALVAAATDAWKARFFQDPHMRFDVPVPGAVELTRALHEAGAHVVYLTGRDLPNMSVGTWMSLRQHGFPIGVVRTSLVCKPRFEIPDEQYKREIAPTLGELGEVIASFDNEPGNCNAFLEAFPQTKSVLLDTQHAPGAPALVPGVYTIGDFTMGGG